MIDRARNSTFKTVYESPSDTSVRNGLHRIIKIVLNKNFPNCQRNIDSEKMEEMCFNTIATDIMNEMRSNSLVNPQYMWTMTVGKSNRCFGEVYAPKSTETVIDI